MQKFKMNSRTVIVAAALVVVLVGGAGAYLISSQPKAKEFKLELWDFGYNGQSGGPTLTVKAGETVRVTLVAKGGVEHELRLVKDNNAFLSDVKNAVEKLQAQGLKEQAAVENATEFKESRRLTGMKIVNAGGVLDWDIDVEVGGTKTVEFVIDRPGTYWYVCGELDATFPLTHAHKGMIGQIIVEP